MWAWGLNTNGQLGDSSTTNREVPVAVSSLTGVAGVSAGASHSLALKTDGTVRAWGLNTNGRLGDGTTTQRLTPVAMTGVASAVSVAAGYRHTCVMLGDGTAKCTGTNTYGELGNDAVVSQSVGAVTPTGLGSGVAIPHGISDDVDRDGLAVQSPPANDEGEFVEVGRAEADADRLVLHCDLDMRVVNRTHRAHGL